MSSDVEVTTTESGDTIFGTLQQNWGLILFLGILFLVLGFIGLGSLFALTLSSAFFFGILIIVGEWHSFLTLSSAKGGKVSHSMCSSRCCTLLVEFSSYKIRSRRP